MGVDSIGSQTSGSYGVPKNNISAVTNESSQYVAEEHNRKVLGLIASETAIGTTVSPAVGSHERRINDDETAIAALEAVRDNDPPVLITAGTIAGINEVNDDLIFSPSTFFNADTRDRQWQKDAGGGFSNIVGEIGLSYEMVPIDAGTLIRCVETGTNANPGSTPANSNAITVKPFFNVAPALVNDTTATFPAVQGDVLSVDISGLLGSTSETYQWLDTNGVAIPGADQPTYTVDTGETGDGVSCLVTATNAGGSTPATTAEEAVSAAPIAFDSASVSANGTEVTIQHTRPVERLFFDWESFAINGTLASPRWLRISGSSIVLELDRPVLASETVTVDYTKPANRMIRDTEENELDSYVAEPVANGSTVESPAERLGASLVEAWDETTIQSSGDETAIATWDGIENTLDLTASGTPIHQQTAPFGPKGVNSAQCVAESLFSDAVGLGDLPSGSDIGAFATGLAFRLNDESDGQTISLWQDTGGSAKIALATSAGDWQLVLTNDAGTDTTIALGEIPDLREHYVVISYAGSGGALRVDWDGSTLIDQGSTSASGTATFDRFAVGDGATDAQFREAFVGNSALSTTDFTAVNLYFAGRYDNPRPQQHTTRHKLIDTNTANAPSNVMHACIVEAPDWMADPPGRFLMWFGDHDADEIFVAFADSLLGPWAVQASGTTDWNLTTLLAARGGGTGTNVTSPHVVVDDVNERLVGFAHHEIDGDGQNSHCAISTDGVGWTYQNSGANLSTTFTLSSYFRPFEVAGTWYSTGARTNLFRSSDPDGLSGYEVPVDDDLFQGVPAETTGIICRHGGVIVDGMTLTVYFSRIGEQGERILRATVDASGDWETWQMQTPVEVIEPLDENDFEGGQFPWVFSAQGTGDQSSREMQDPQIYEHSDGSRWIVYTGLSEGSIGLVQISDPTTVTLFEQPSTNVAGDEVTLVWNQDMDTGSAPVGGITFGGTTAAFDSAAWSGARTLVVTVVPAIAAEDAPTISIAADTVQSTGAEGNEAITDAVVKNNVPATSGPDDWNPWHYWLVNSGITIDTNISEWEGSDISPATFLQASDNSKPHLISADPDWNNEDVIDFLAGDDLVLDTADESLVNQRFLHDGTSDYFIVFPFIHANGGNREMFATTNNGTGMRIESKAGTSCEAALFNAGLQETATVAGMSLTDPNIIFVKFEASSGVISISANGGASWSDSDGTGTLASGDADESLIIGGESNGIEVADIFMSKTIPDSQTLDDIFSWYTDKFIGV